LAFYSSVIQIEFFISKQCFSLNCFQSSYRSILGYGYRTPILVISKSLTNYRAVIIIRRACFRSDNTAFVRRFWGDVDFVLRTKRFFFFPKALPANRVAESGFQPRKHFLFELSSVAKCLCTKSERQTRSGRGTWTWSEKDNLYSRRIIPPRKTKTEGT